MTLAEFNDAVKKIAAGRYCAASVEVNNHTDGEMRLEWGAYIDVIGHRKGASPEQCLLGLVTVANKVPELGEFNNVVEPPANPVPATEGVPF